MRTCNELESQLALWHIVTHEVAMLALSSRPPLQSARDRARDDAFLRSLQAMVDAARRDERPAQLDVVMPEPTVRRAPSRRRVPQLVWGLRQLIAADRELVALVAAYERGLEGEEAAAAADLSRSAHRASLARLKVICDQLDLFDRVRPTRH